MINTQIFEGKVGMVQKIGVWSCDERDEVLYIHFIRHGL